MRTVLAGGRVPGGMGRALHAMLGGIWLGLLSESQLRELDEHYYRSDNTYRSDAWNERGLFDWEREAIGRSFRAGSSIVVIACGGGREVLELLRMGFDAIGYESHPDLCAYAQSFLAEHGYPDRLREMPRDRFPLEARGEGVLLGWGAYSLIAWREQRVTFLRDAGAAVAGDGPVMLSSFARQTHGRSFRLTSRIAGALRRLRAGRPIELGDTLAPNRLHVFTRLEMASEIEEAGLSLESYEIVGAAEPTTGYVCAVARSRTCHA